MKYQVHLSEKAEADVDGVLAWFQTQLASAAGTRWFAALWKSIDTLETKPERCALAAEAAELGTEVRELLFGRRRGVYRILFQIREKSVQILRVWHSARDAIRPEDL